jgi:hypothetical protein
MPDWMMACRISAHTREFTSPLPQRPISSPLRFPPAESFLSSRSGQNNTAGHATSQQAIRTFLFNQWFGASRNKLNPKED